MTPLPGPIAAQSAGSSLRVIQGFFPGGRPRILHLSPAPAAPVRPQVPAPVQARPASPPAPILPGRPADAALFSRRSARPTSPADPADHRFAPGTLQPATPPRPQMPQPILPQLARPATVQPQAGNAFALPANFTLKPRGSGQPLPEPIQKKMESFFNTSFADVRIHVGHEAPSIGALAFTHGTDLYFAPGQYNPQSTQGQQLLGHELTHVVQQRAGRVREPAGRGGGRGARPGARGRGRANGAARRVRRPADPGEAGGACTGRRMLSGCRIQAEHGRAQWGDPAGTLGGPGFLAAKTRTDSARSSTGPRESCSRPLFASGNESLRATRDRCHRRRHGYGPSQAGDPQLSLEPAAQKEGPVVPVIRCQRRSRGTGDVGKSAGRPQRADQQQRRVDLLARPRISLLCEHSRHGSEIACALDSIPFLQRNVHRNHQARVVSQWSRQEPPEPERRQKPCVRFSPFVRRRARPRTRPRFPGHFSALERPGHRRSSLGSAEPVLRRSYIDQADLQPQIPSETGIVPVLLDR